MRYEHGADPRRQARLRPGRDLPRRRCVRVAARRPSSATRARWASARTSYPNIHIDCYGAYTNNPPCGAMRGFGSVQTAFAVEAQMDKLADAVGLDPRRDPGRATRCTRARPAPTGQVIDSAAPVAELVERLRGDAAARTDGLDRLGPATPARRCLQHHPRRGRSPRRRLRRRVQERRRSPRASTTTRPPGCGWRSSAGSPHVTVHTAAAEVGQGLVTVEQQICRTELGVDTVVVASRRTPRSGRRARRRRRGRPT